MNTVYIVILMLNGVNELVVMYVCNKAVTNLFRILYRIMGLTWFRPCSRETYFDYMRISATLLVQ